MAFQKVQEILDTPTSHTVTWGTGSVFLMGWMNTAMIYVEVLIKLGTLFYMTSMAIIGVIKVIKLIKNRKRK